MATSQVIQELPDDIAPLYESIDPDALSDLFADRSTDGVVVFEHDGYQITARSTGDVEITEA